MKNENLVCVCVCYALPNNARTCRAKWKDYCRTFGMQIQVLDSSKKFSLLRSYTPVRYIRELPVYKLIYEQPDIIIA